MILGLSGGLGRFLGLVFKRAQKNFRLKCLASFTAE
jgi:hypothetical protein